MTAAPVPVAFTVDPWDPGYGLAYNEELDGGALEESSAELNLDLEVPAAQWRPIDPRPSSPVARHRAVPGWRAAHRRAHLGTRP